MVQMLITDYITARHVRVAGRDEGAASLVEEGGCAGLTHGVVKDAEVGLAKTRTERCAEVAEFRIVWIRWRWCRRSQGQRRILGKALRLLMSMVGLVALVTVRKTIT